MTHWSATLLLSALPGFYLREVSEPSLTDPSVSVMLCQYLTVFENSTALLMEVTYMDGENCVNSTADPLWMQTTRAQTTSSSTVRDLHCAPHSICMLLVA